MYLVRPSDPSSPLIQRSGLKEYESGKILSSWWTKYVDMLMGVYFARQFTAIIAKEKYTLQVV